MADHAACCRRRRTILIVGPTLATINEKPQVSGPSSALPARPCRAPALDIAAELPTLAINTLRVPCACAWFCDNAVWHRLFRAPVAPTAFRRRGAASFREKFLRAAS